MYKLYVGELQKIPESVNYSFYAGKDLLLYTDTNPGDGFVEVTDSLLHLLNEEERSWLAMCKLHINTEHIAENTSSYMLALETFISELEVELHSKAKKKKGADDGSEN